MYLEGRVSQNFDIGLIVITLSNVEIDNEKKYKKLPDF